MAIQTAFEEPHRAGSTEAEAHCARLVLAVYSAVMASSRNEQRAFTAAVQTYRGENPSQSDEEARRAVAEIISHKP